MLHRASHTFPVYHATSLSVKGFLLGRRSLRDRGGMRAVLVLYRKPTPGMVEGEEGVHRTSK